MQIESGEYYIRRDGEIAGPARRGCIDDTRFPWHMKSGISGRSYTNDGHWFDDGDEHDHDLVAHLPRTDPRHPEHCGENPLQIDISTVASEPGQQSATIDLEPDPRISAGNWWVDFEGNRFVYVNGFDGWLIRQYVDCVSSESIEQNSGENPAVLHLPDCDSFDWEEPVRETVGLVEYFCRGSNGHEWTLSMGTANPRPGGAIGIVISSRYERGLRVVEVERLP